jgi:hypothetical protein
MGLAPGVRHLANFPLAALHRNVLAGAFGGHFVNLPLASLHDAARTGVDSMASAAAAAKTMRMVFPSSEPGTKMPMRHDLCKRQSASNMATAKVPPVSKASFMNAISKSVGRRIGPN